jgi:hypothetical protein
MLGNLYSVSIAAQAQTAAKTLIEITAASTAVSTVERIWLTQSTFDTSENLSCKVQRVTTTGTGTSFTPRKLMNSAPAYAGAVETNSTVEPTYTASTDIINQGFNVLSGFIWTPASDDEIISIPPSGLLGIMLNTAPSASMSFDYGCIIREIG